MYLISDTGEKTELSILFIENITLFFFLVMGIDIQRLRSQKTKGKRITDSCQLVNNNKIVINFYILWDLPICQLLTI